MTRLSVPSRRALAPRMFAVAALSIVLSLVMSSPAHAQLPQVCLALNEGGSGSEYLSVISKGGLEGNSAYTIEAWVYPTSFAGFPTIVGNDYTASYWLGLNTSGRVRFYPRGAASGYVEGSDPLPLNAWSHVAAVYNSASGWLIYVNGGPDAWGSSITGAVGTSAGDLRIGADRSGGSPAYFWHGYLDEIRIWSSARTATEIREAIYVGAGRPSAFTNGIYNALQANWTADFPFTTGIGDVGTGTGNFASFVNGDYHTETTFDHPSGPPVAPNVALRLNGIDDRVVLPVSETFTRGLTIMAWIAPTSVIDYPTIAGRDYNTSFWLGIAPGGKLRFYPTPSYYLDGTSAIPTNRWTHVAATYDGARTVLYVNGQVNSVSTTISGPVGANGRDVWIGADNELGGLAFPFQGYIDEVKVVQGALSAGSIRSEMFTGYPEFTTSFSVPDAGGVPVSLYHVSVDYQETLSILGAGASIARGGTAAVNPLSPISSRLIPGFWNSITGGFSLPDDAYMTLITAPTWWLTNQTVSQVEVFLSASLNDLANTEISLRSPRGTTQDLLALGDGRGRDLLTVIADNATDTWATGSSPYLNGVKPSLPLSGFNGEGTLGEWTLQLTGWGSQTRVGLWAWGLRLNGLATGVAAGASENGTAAGPRLRLAGPNPAAGTSTIAFDLARPAHVDLALYDVSGREVQKILSGDQQPGSFVMNVSTSGLAAGVYFATLRVDGQVHGRLKLSVVP